ncbi:ROK family transcriptional regulator [Planotetraspora sp. GP83]|uniref:ROK family transcriptional regulator n=1 Tax=Planotetraspora sp. GP83 TaxID=3156264 RepID=UPI003516D9D9
MAIETGGSLRSLRISNRERLLELLLGEHPLLRAELARRAGLSRTTVSTIVGELLEAGLIVETSDDSAVSDGRAKDALAVNPRAAAAVGIDFADDRVWVHLSDLAGDEMAGGGAALAPHLDWPRRLETCLSLLRSLLAETGLSERQVIGYGIGASSSSTGVTPAELGDRFPGAHVQHSAQLEAVAEARLGAGRGARSLFYVSLSTDIGAGLIVDGEPYRGTAGAGGRLGHLSIDFNGPLCACGNRGCLVLYAGLPAVRETLRPVLGDQDLLAALASGNRACENVLAEVGETVGRALAGVCNLVNPERIVVGGDLAVAGEVLLEPLRTTLRRYALPVVREAEVVGAALDLGTRGAAVGGAALVLGSPSTLVAALSRLSAAG